MSEGAGLPRRVALIDHGQLFAYCPGVARAQAETIQLLSEVLVRLGNSEAAALLAARWDGPAAGAPGGRPPRRQQQHRAFMRAYATALPGAVILATENEALADFVLTPAFGALHPYNPECWAKFEYLLRRGHLGNSAGWAKLWDRAAELWLAESARISQSPITRLSIFNALMAVSGGAAVLHQAGYRDRWRALWARACKGKAVEQPYVRMNLAVLGSHVGEGDAQVEWLLDKQHRQLEMADFLLFVRADRSTDIPQLFARLVRNEPGALVDYLLPSRPAASLNRLFRFIRATMRRKENFSSPSLVLATLSWAGAGIDLARELARDGLITERDRAALLRSLRAAEQVQRMEKNRFWDVVEWLPAGPLRRRIEELWSYISPRNATS